MTARVRRIDGPTYGDLWRESPTAIAPDIWGPASRRLEYQTPDKWQGGAHRWRLPWATMYVRPTREVA